MENPWYSSAKRHQTYGKLSMKDYELNYETAYEGTPYGETPYISRDSWSCSFSRPLFEAFSSPRCTPRIWNLWSMQMDEVCLSKYSMYLYVFVRLKRNSLLSKAQMWQAAWQIRPPFQCRLFQSSSGGISPIMILGSSSRAMVSKTCTNCEISDPLMHLNMHVIPVPIQHYIKFTKLQHTSHIHVLCGWAKGTPTLGSQVNDTSLSMPISLLLNLLVFTIGPRWTLVFLHANKIEIQI